MPSPDLTYIVSCYSWVDQLATCLHALKAQSHKDFEVIVTDNSTTPQAADEVKAIVRNLGDKRFRYFHTAPLIAVGDCYWAADEGIARAHGKWLCFPCEDIYYPPEWGSWMLAAAYRANLDLVLCERVVFGPRTSVHDSFNAVTFNDDWKGCKSSFIVKASAFPGWTLKPTTAIYAGIDRATVTRLVASLR